MKPINYQQYLLYIKSSAWQEKKARYWKSQRVELLSKNANWKIRCGCCKNKFDSIKEMDVHHKSYRNFGNEKLTELIHVCRECHNKIHSVARSLGINMYKNGNQNTNLWNITEQVKDEGKKRMKKLKRQKKVFL